MKLNQYLILISLLFLFASCSKEDSEGVYEEIDLFELDDFVLKQRSDFEKHFENFYVQEYSMLPYYGLDTENGVYEITTAGVDPGSLGELIFWVYARYMETETTAQGIERLQRIANLHFTSLPDETYINLEPYSFERGELIQVDDLNKFYNQAIADKIESIEQIWRKEGFSYLLTLRDGKVEITIGVIPE
ncbi:hypothetical protein [Labilibaculum sp.]|uniref:hypothetical protein n=1 Tax=Labilibaculum sp. TaxID=2060723 RepID=UPI002AA7ED30|nr:hypothetical protein [Labilibaculum sp.]MBN2598348.1 hypothetical protein [Marinifilaceae bacterium]